MTKTELIEFIIDRPIAGTGNWNSLTVSDRLCQSDSGTDWEVLVYNQELVTKFKNLPDFVLTLTFDSKLGTLELGTCKRVSKFREHHMVTMSNSMSERVSNFSK